MIDCYIVFKSFSPVLYVNQCITYTIRNTCAAEFAHKKPDDCKVFMTAVK